MKTLHSETGSRCEFVTYHITPEKDGGVATQKMDEPFAQFMLTDDDSAHALVIKRTYKTGKPTTPETTTLTVNSPYLLKAFREVIKSYPVVPSSFTAPFQLSDSFHMLIHHWEELDAYRQTVDEAEMRMHLNLLFEFMAHELGPDRDAALRMVNKGQITFAMAWYLFRPGDILYTEIMGEPWLLRCHKTVYENTPSCGHYLEVHCTYTDYDGSFKGQTTKTFTIYQRRQFGGDNPAFITELPVYPRRFVKVGDELEESLKARGERFLNFEETSVHAYDGPADYMKQPPLSFYHPEMAGFSTVWLPYAETGRVVLDRKTFQNDYRSEAVAIKKVDQLEPVFCPPYTIGYSLGLKNWCRFLIDNIRPVEWKQQAWDSLVLPNDQKILLKALISSHRFPENPRDQPEQKGKGLVILLHGTPGSGKTLTAEVAAEETKRAIISASMGDLNRDEGSWAFETQLKRLLQYATLWKAVVLLDEADVFLEVRDERAGNINRNALVAVFLKELEYFSGMVFLTTNRLKTFDLAMKSRVHLALGYSPPGVDTRRKIWRQYLAKVPSEEIDTIDLDGADEAILRESLNGREISGVVNTARTVARFEGKKLQVEHIQRILSGRAAFDQVLNAGGDKK